MKRPRLIKAIAVPAVLALGCLAWIFLWFGRDVEPRYKGVSLSSWMAKLDDFKAVNGISYGDWQPKTAEQTKAAQAIRAIGTNAIPFLLRDLDLEDSRMADLTRRAKEWIGSRFHSAKPNSATATDTQRTRWRAALALDALGPAARPALPRLTEMFSASTNSVKCKDVAFVLAGIGQEGIKVLTNCPKTTAWNFQAASAFWAIAMHPDTCTNLVPWFIERADSQPGGGGAPSAIWALGQIRGCPDLTMPALIRMVNDTNYARYASFAIYSLQLYGTEASNAIPTLQMLTTNSSPLGIYAKGALLRIDPEGSQKHGH